MVISHSDVFSYQSLMKVVSLYNQSTFPDKIFVIILEFLCEIRSQFYDNRRLKSQDSYVNGVPHGEKKGWFNTGYPIKIILDHEKSYIVHGQIRNHFYYINGKEHGVWRCWYKMEKKGKCQISWKNKYHNGLKNGLSEGWYKDGTLMFQESFSNGLRHGVLKRWDSSGIIYRNVFYIKGKLRPEKECCICFDAKVNSVIHPCGHTMTCHNCALQISSRYPRCPMCRTAITNVVQTFR